MRASSQSERLSRRVRADHGRAARERSTRALFAAWLDTPLGPMTAIADERALYLLEFVDRRGLEREIERLRQRQKAGIAPGRRRRSCRSKRSSTNTSPAAR